MLGKTKKINGTKKYRQKCYPGGFPVALEALFPRMEELRPNIVWDEKLRSVCVRLEQLTEKAKQLEDESNAIFALKRAFPADRVIWLAIIVNLFGETAVQFQTISETRKNIKDQESQLSALRTKKQQFQLPA